MTTESLTQPHMKSTATFRTTLGLMLALGLGTAAQATTDTWTGAGADNYWATAGNWGGTAPNATGDNLIFAGSTRPLSTNNLVTSVGWVQLNPTAAFNCFGSALTVNGAFTNSAQNNTLIFPLVLGGNVNFDVASGTTLSLSNVVSGAAGIVQTSAGTLALNNLANTFTGPVSVTNGILQLGNVTTTATYSFPGSTIAVNKATLFFNGSSGGTVTHTYNFANLTAPIGVTNSNVKFQSSNATTEALNGAFAFSGTNIITYTSSAFTHNLNFNRAITGSGLLTLNWSGTTSGRSVNINDTLNGNNFTGTLVLNATPTAGNFNLNKPLGPVAFVVSNAWTIVNVATNNLDSAASVSLNSSGSGLNLSSYGWSNSAAPLSINAGTMIMGNATTGTVVYVGNLAGAGGVITNTGAMPSSLSVTETANNTFSGAINDSSAAPLAFTKNGTATLTLAGTNGYTGATLIAAGGLQVNGLLTSTQVTVNAGATIGGTGTLLGNTTVNAGGTVATLGTTALALNALTLGASPTDAITLTVKGDGTTVAGSVLVTGAGGFTNNGKVTVNVTGALPATLGAYPLLSYTGGSAGTGTFVAGTLTSGVLGYITNDTSASAVELVVTGADFLRWTGTPTSTWDLSGASVWALGSSGLPAAYADTKRVVFDDSATSFAVNVGTVVAPGGVTVSNNVNTYTLSGSGKITGGTSLTKDGTGTAMVATVNDYTAATTILNGTLQLGDGTANNGNLAGSINNGAALVFANPGSQTYAGAISGAGTVTKQSAGALTLSGNNTYSGVTTISAGTLLAGSTNALGNTTGGTIVSGGTLDVNGKNLGAEPVTIAGTGAGTNGVVFNSGAAQTSALQFLTLSANSTIGGLNRWDVRDGGLGASLNLNGYTLTKTTTNDISLVGATISDGTVVINQGRLGFHLGTAFPAGAGQIVVNPAGTMWIGDFGTPLQVYQPVTLNGGAIQSDSGTTATLNSPVTMTTNSTISAGVPTYFDSAIGGSGLLTVSGASTLILDASNTWSGGLLISTGATVQIGNNDVNGYLPANVGVVTNNGLLAYSCAADLVFTQAMVGTGGLMQAGPDTISITNVQSYTGGTVLSAGTLLLGAGNNTLSNATSLSFIGSAYLNLGTNSQQVATITMNNTMNSYIQGSGALTVIGTNDLRLGSTGNTTPSLDMSGLNAFSYNQPGKVFSVGGQATAANSAGSVNLALTNAITANRFGIADAGGYPGYTSAGSVNLGTVNVIDANAIDVGYGSTGAGGWGSTGTLGYYPGTTNPTLVIRDATGSGRANITVGYASNSDYSSGNGTVDLADNITGTSTLDALVGSLIIGQHTYPNVNQNQGAVGAFTMQYGLLDATNIVLGQKTYSGGRTASYATGTFTLNGGTVKANTMTIGDQVATNGPSVTGTFNLNSGTLLAGLIKAGAGNASRSLNWNDGVIRNYTNSDLSIYGVAVSLSGAGTPTCYLDAGHTGTLTGTLSGGGPLVKAGGGTLVLNGDSSSFSGSLTNQAGAVYVNGPMPSGVVEAYAGTLVGGSNTVGTIQLDNGAVMQAGDITGAGVLGSGILNLGAVGSSTDITHSRLNLAAGGGFATTTLSVNGTNVIDLSGTITATGTNNLILYTGTIGGSGLSGFKLGTLPTGVTAHLQDNTGVALQLVVTSATSNTPTNITTSVSGHTLTLSWPADHLGWRLQSQTNSLTTGLTTNWFTWPNSTNVTSVPVAMDPTAPTVFFRLVYP